MHKYFRFIAFLMLALVLSITGCRIKKEDKILAKIGDRIITVGDFEKRFRPKEFPSDEEEKEEKMKILNSLIEEKLFAIAGEKEGMAEEIEKNMSDYTDRLAVNELYESIIVKRAKVSLLEQKRTYRMMGKELHARHIVLETKEKADSIYKELIKNDAKNFAELARKSIDPKTKDKGGDLGWLSWGKMNPEQQDVAYKLKVGGISKPFQIRIGWDILQIVDEKDKKIRAFEEEKDNIIKTLKRQKMNKMANDYLEKLKKRAKIHYDTTVINIIISKVPTDKPATPFEPSPLPVLTEDEGKKIISSSILGEMTATEFIEKIEKMPRRPPLNSVETLVRFIEGDLINQLLVNQARRMHLHKSPVVLKNYNNTKDNRISGEYIKKYLVPREEIPEVEIKDYYEKHKEDFKIEEKRTAHIVVVRTEKEADDIYRTIKRGGDIRKIAKGKSIHHT
ncbi:peptidylprolyl isomerase, partial [candidate division WOR-3 bacterium]|nr:peptidylprolyl isomerase [candidate division WOR-3 bacterium]